MPNVTDEPRLGVAPEAAQPPKCHAETLALATGSAFVTFAPNIECEWSYDRDLPPNSLVIPWLHLPWISPNTALMQDQPRPIGLPLVRQQLYDTLLESQFGQTLKRFEAKLRDIFPRSFLFRLPPTQIEYHNVAPRLLTIRDFVELSHQILSIDFERPIAGETSLAELARILYSRIPEQTRSKTHREIAGELEELRLMGVGLEDSFWILLPNVKDQPRPSRAVGCSAWLGRFSFLEELIDKGQRVFGVVG